MKFRNITGDVHFFFLLIFFFAITNCYGQDACRSNSGDFEGVCKTIYECPVVLHQLQRGESYTRCIVNSRQFFVCCPTFTTTTMAPSRAPETLRIHEKKSCTVRKSNEAGACRPIYQCPEVFDQIRRKQNDYTVCPTRSSILQVCCPIVKPTGVRASDTQTTFQATGPIHVAKCKEYGEFVYEEFASIPLVVGAQKNVKKNDKCGIKSIPLVRGGENASPLEFPHMALLGYEVDGHIEWRCGGSLISENFILTAAHCMNNKREPRIIRVGDLNIAITTDDAKPVDIPVQQIIIFPNYNKRTKEHDIALIRMSKNVQFDIYKRPACLPSTHDWQRPNAIATGWGYNSSSNMVGTSHLQKVALDKFSEADCNNVLKSSPSLAKAITYQYQVCAGSQNEAKDTCKGDSGGPLQTLHPSVYCMYEIVGVTSFGDSFCGSPGVPGVYTRVYPYLNWIQSIVWK